MLIPNVFSISRPRCNKKTSNLLRRKGGGGDTSGHTSDPAESPSTSNYRSQSSTAEGLPPALVNFAAERSFTVPSGSAFAYASGGGVKFTLGSDTPFAGRQAGAGERSQVYGTSRYGSGYPYGVSGSYITDRPFPFVFYPIPITPYNYYGSQPYTNINDTQRPGGALAEALIQPANNTANLTFRIIGDNASISAVYAVLVVNCSVANTSTAISTFTPSLTRYPLPEQIVQWYRASTFALSLDAYNNSASLLSNMPPSDAAPALPLSSDTPLPSGLDMAFLQCVNATIGASVPLVGPPVGQHFSGLAIAGVVLMGIGFVLSVLSTALDLYCQWRRRQAGRMKMRGLGGKL